MTDLNTPETETQRPDAARRTSTATARPQAERSFDPSRLDVRTSDRSGRSADRSADAWRQALQPIVSLNADITRVMDQAWRQMTGFGMMGGLRPAEPVAANGWAALFGAPPADLVETEKAYTLRIEVPGLKREDVDILLKDEALLVSGQKVETREEGPGAYRLSERRYGRFERLVPLPQDVDPQTVEADLQDGVLTISLPKTEAASQAWRRIEIN